MAASAERRRHRGPAGPNHGLRIFLIWLPIAVAADLLIWIVWGPHLPPAGCRRPRPASSSTSR